MIKFRSKSIIYLFILVLISLLKINAGDLPYHQTNGYGTQTNGGLDGYVYLVTHLGNYGSGSLRYALEASYPRLVVFEVGGVIDLDMDNINIKNPYITIAGQTAPGPGITVIKGSINIGTHDVVIQHIAVRPGDAAQPKQSGWEPDGMTTYGTDTYNIVFDHCSATWAVDENLSVSGPGDSQPMTSSHDVTLYRCIVAEGLFNSSHSKGIHSMGTLLHDGVSRISIIGCLYAHNNQRNPLFKGNSSAVFVNNVVYNSGSYAIQMSDYGTDSNILIGQSQGAIVGNVWIKGNDSSTRPFIRSSQSRASGKVYMQDNLLIDRSGNPQEATDAYLELVNEPPLWPEELEAVPSYISVYDVLRSAGSRAGNRDSIDVRIVNSVINGTGRIIDSQEEVGGYPEYEMAAKSLTVPDSTDDRRIWLDSLSSEIDTDNLLDTSPLQILITGISDKDLHTDSYDLKLTNYPNPFNPSTTIEYSLDTPAYRFPSREGKKRGVFVELKVYDILGREVVTLVDTQQHNPGTYKVKFDGTGFSTGVYFYTLRYGDRIVNKKMQLLK